MRRETHIALWLNWIAGYVDAVGYIAFYHVFLGNMTGNTIAIAEGLTLHRGELLLKRGLAIPEFIGGLIVSRLIMEVLVRKQVARRAAWGYGLELIALFALAFVGTTMAGNLVPVEHASSSLYLLVALGSFAMGIQNATLSHFGPLDIRTTHVTGTLSKFVDHLVKWLLNKGEGEGGKAWLYFSSWFLYLLGSIIGLALMNHWNLYALYVPATVLLVIVCLNLWCPQEQVR